MIPFGSFSLLPDRLVNSSLRNLKSKLKEGGKLLLTIMTKNSEIEEFSEWIESNRKHFDNETIVEYKKVHYDEKNMLLNIRLKYQSLQGEHIEKEIMEFPIRLYYSGEFEILLKSNGFNNIAVHEVKNGYGEGSSFNVYECAI
jgi:hypothetical protein